MQTKKCPKCGLEQYALSFYADRTKKSGLSSYCKSCALVKAKAVRERDPENAKQRSRKYYKENKEQILAENKAEYAKDPDPIRTKNALSRRRNAEKRRQDSRQYRLEHPETNSNYYHKNKIRIRQRRKERRLEILDIAKEKERVQRRKRIAEDINYKISCRLRSRMSGLVRGIIKGGSAVRDLGCSIDEFRKYLESHWTEGMCWDNYGIGKSDWSIDHIYPLSLFDLTNRQHFILANHYLNLRPLWQIENREKSNKVA